MATINFYLDSRSPKSDGTCPLKFSVTHKGKRRYLSLGVSVRLEHWDEARGCVQPKAPLSAKVNRLLCRYRLDADEALLDVIADKGAAGASFEDVFNAVRYAVPGEAPRKATFVERLNAFAALKKVGTKQLYMQTLSRMRAFCPGVESLHFEDLTVEWLTRFDAFMAMTAPSRNARNIHLRNIRAVFNDAVAAELTSFYPFRRFKIRAVATPKRSLSVEQLRMLFDYPVEDYAVKYVDIFKLMFMLCGINAVDLFGLQRVVDGRVEYYRAKTGRFYSLKVEPEAMEIFDR